jgi:drug/metabolite transporter (DMT)-like permease
VLRKLLAPHLSPLAVVFWVALGQAPVLVVWALSSGAPAVSWRYAAVAGGSVALNVVANVAFVRALAGSPLSLTVPLLSLIPAFTAAFALPLLGERLRLVQVGGILLVVGGALLLGGAMAGGLSVAGWWRALRREPGTPLMLTVAVCWSLALPLDKMGVTEVGAAWHGVALVAGVSAATLGLLLLRGRRHELALSRRVAPALMGAIVVAIVALILQLLAIQEVYVGIVESVKRVTGNVGALLAGAAVFAEPIGWRKTAALLAMAGGVLLILLPP